jgi:hypothetical protein
MNALPRKSRVAFVVIKLSVLGIAYYLMRVDPKWKDINLIGGHEKHRDSGNLEKTARRELWEEVPSIRDYSQFDVVPLTPELPYGPIESRSKGAKVEYELRFFLLKIMHSPENLVAGLSDRTRNIWVSEQDLLLGRRFRVSGLVRFLMSNITGGLQSIPYSSTVDLYFMQDRITQVNSRQMMLALI